MSAINIAYDPVFASYGMKVVSYETANAIREYNFNLPPGSPVQHYIPQPGFQEQVACCDADVLVIGGRRGAGKMQSVESKVVTPFGLRRLGDLKVGSIITDPVTGGMERVIQIYEHPQKDCYAVMFSDGTETTCGLEHLWKARLNNNISKKRVLNGLSLEEDYRIYTFQQIKDFLDRQERGELNNGKDKKCFVVPLTAPVHFTKSGHSGYMNIPDEVDPYVVGVLIGDGCMLYNNVQITSEDQAVFDEIEKAGYKLGVIKQRDNSNCITRSIISQPLRDFLRKQNILGKRSQEKSLPACFKYGSVDVRTAVLQGLMDTDGCCDKAGHCFFYTTSKTLAEDVQFIVESLGGTASIRTDNNSGYKKDGVFIQCSTSYDVYIKMKDTTQLFRLPRKKERCRPFNGGISEVTRKIVGYRYLGKMDCRCITVDSPNSLYATDHFIVTHNTFIITLLPLRDIKYKGFTGIGFRKELDDIKDGLWHESMQFYPGFATPKESAYEWKFQNGAYFRYDQLQNESETDRRFRGLQIPFMLIDELPQIQLSTFFTLLASNRNSLGIKNTFIGTCNPQEKSHWLYKLIKWYINEETGEIRPDRDGRKRYFYKYGDTVEEMYWGDSKEEVYEKAKGEIDKVYNSNLQNAGLDWRNLITSFCFIEGRYEDNKLFIKNDPNYYGRLAQQGGVKAIMDMQGKWGGIDNGNADISAEDFCKLFTNPMARTGRKSLILDVALITDDCTFGIFDGDNLEKVEVYKGVGSDDITALSRSILQREGIVERNFVFDASGVGQFLRQPFHSDQGGAIAFAGNSAAEDPKIYRNIRAQCFDALIRGIREGKRSVSPEAAETKLPDGRTLMEHLIEQRKVLIRVANAPKEQFISKPEMRQLLGGKRSPDEMDMLMMHEVLRIMRRVGGFSGIESLRYFS